MDPYLRLDRLRRLLEDPLDEPERAGVEDPMQGCPGRDRLECLVSEPFDLDVPEEIERHVQACTACQQVLEALTSAPDWGRSRQGWRAAALPEIEDFLRRLQQSPPPA